MYSIVSSKPNCRILLVLTFHSIASHGLYSLLEDVFKDVFQHLQKYVFLNRQYQIVYVFDECFWECIWECCNLSKNCTQA